MSSMDSPLTIALLPQVTFPNFIIIILFIVALHSAVEMYSAVNNTWTKIHNMAFGRLL